ncbi:hypothetical protein ACFY2M_38515 [Streptomyces sp. NPDC001276]|uniref:hypothetical protein n=1 Tax=Streptomyces sp. NPDC001276 TaxID=3364555 RepID=UPI0036A7E834
MQQLAQRMAADQAAMYKAINAPGVRLAQEVAARMAAAMPQLDLKLPRVDTALPRIDIPGYTPQLRSGGGETHRDDAEQTGQQKASGPDTPESAPDRE